MIEPYDFMREAERLLSDAGNDEIRCRSAASRAYYSFYHEALQYLVKNGYRPVERDKNSMHKYVRECYYRIGNTQGSFYALAKTLHRAYQQRIRADYDLSDTVNEEEVRDTLRRVRVAINSLDNADSAHEE